MNRLVRDEEGRFVAHRTWLKVLLNPVLRALQFWTERPYVIVSHIGPNGQFLRYELRRKRLWKEK